MLLLDVVAAAVARWLLFPQWRVEANLAAVALPIDTCKLSIGVTLQLRCPAINDNNNTRRELFIIIIIINQVENTYIHPHTHTQINI